jgi:hypothetical protein
MDLVSFRCRTYMIDNVCTYRDVFRISHDDYISAPLGTVWVPGHKHTSVHAQP